MSDQTTNTDMSQLVVGADKAPPAPRVHSETADVGRLLELAIDKGIPVENLERLADLYRQAHDRQARQRFIDALHQFQQECGPVPKKSTARIVKATGGAGWSFQYAQLDDIAAHIKPLLLKYGLTYTWDSKVDEKMLSCTCVLRHIDGHQSDATFTCPVDAGGVMSASQRCGSALTYARRMSLIQVLGLTTCDPDDDGAGTIRDPITDEQARQLNDQLIELEADVQKFLNYMGVERLADIAVSDLPKAQAALDQKRRQRDV